MIYDIFNFFTGYVYVKLEGARLERVLNSGLTTWRVSRHGYSCIYACMSYSSLRKLQKDSSIKATLISEYGLFALLKRLWGKKVLFFGMIFAMTVLLVLSQMVLTIEINGYYHLNPQEIEQEIKSLGIKPFTFKHSIDLDKLCEQLQAKDNVAWASAGYDGVVLNVEIIEQVSEYDNTPCDIVASRQAIIKDIDVYAGRKNAAEGDAVNAGDVLVAGIVQNGDEVSRIKARADVIGTVWERDSFIIDTKGVNIQATGNSTEEKYIDFWGNKAYIKRKDRDYEHYVIAEKTERIGGVFGLLPIKYVNLTYNEVRLDSFGTDINELTVKAGMMAFEKTAEKLPQDAKIILCDYSYELNESELKATVLIEAEVNIAKEQK